MNDIAIRADQLTKKYTIQVGDATQSTLAEGVTSAFQRLCKNIARSTGSVATHVEEIWPLKEASFEIKRGEVVGVIGRNGAGKSTLLKILSRITEPTSGRAEIFGRVGTLLEVGTGFHPELTGRDNIYLSGIILGMKKAEIDKVFDEIVDFSGISRFVDTPVKRYSSGMYVRLAFAVGAHLNPEVLIVDEVLAVGDLQFQQRCLDKMHQIGGQGRTVLFVSHNLSAITRICPRAILLEGGRISADGPSHKVVGAYLHAGFRSQAFQEWTDPGTAPGDEAVRLRAVRVRRADGHVTDAIDIRQDFAIEIEYDVLQPEQMLFASLRVLNEEGVQVFDALDMDLEWRKRRRPVGRYVSAGMVPGNLLGEGTFFINVACTQYAPSRDYFYVNQAVAFQIIDSMDGDTARGDWGGELGGLIRPLLKWQTRFTPR